MPPDSLWQAQAALYAHLTADEDVTALLAQGPGSIYDHVPPASAFPYIVLAEMQARPLDTQAHSAWDVACRIEAFSRHGGMRDIHRLLAALHASLHNAEIAIESHAVVLCHCEELAAFRESDGETWQGRLQLRLVVEPAGI